MKMANMKSKLRKFICWQIVPPSLSLGATIYGVIHLKNLGVNPTDIMLGAVMGLLITFVQLEYYLGRQKDENNNG